MDIVRPSWDNYFLAIAGTVAIRGECTRRQIGAIVVKDRRILSTGYNGAPAGAASCLDGACPRGLMTREHLPPGGNYDEGPGQCIAIHAEANALLRADFASCAGATLYATDWPCYGCMKLIAAAKIDRIVTGGHVMEF